MKKISIEIKWGIIFFIISLVWMIFEKAMGWHGAHIDQHATFTNLFAIPAIILYVVALLDKRRNYYNGQMTWKQGFIAGLMIAIVVAVLSPISQLLTHYWISPDYFANAIKHAVNSGEMAKGEARSYFSLGSYILQSAIGSLVMGTVTGAVVAVFVKRKG